MRERGIIMGPESVRALLAGRKSQTRCVVKGVPAGADEVFVWTGDDVPPGAPRARPGVYARKHGPDGWLLHIGSQRLTPGDRLWVKEAFMETIRGLGARYRADKDRPEWRGLWRTPIFMPRWASRLTLEVTEVRVQRVQEISEDDARAVGVPLIPPMNYRDGFEIMWNQINGKLAPWSANPWVWALTFRVVAARAAGEGR